ncbi:hypothetical protein BC940DRAFT_288317 [Gongronella butleri]|nr:hypothetical protein BC940DRAFT_288317 [Gongronella butleri]
MWKRSTSNSKGAGRCSFFFVSCFLPCLFFLLFFRVPRQMSERDSSLASLHELIDQSRRQFNLPPYISPLEYDAWKQQKVDNAKQQQELLEQAKQQESEFSGRERYVERLSTFSALFINSDTPVSAEQAAKQGWQDSHEQSHFGVSHAFRLVCMTCSRTLQVPNLTGFSSLATAKKMYDQYPLFLQKSHDQECFWSHNTCQDTVTSLPLTTTSDLLDRLEIQAKEYGAWTTALPVIKHPFDASKLRMVDRVIKLIEQVDVFQFPQPQIDNAKRTAYLLSMFGWSPAKDQPALIKCDSCFRHAMVDNYFRLDDPLDDEMQLQVGHPRRPACIRDAFDMVLEHRDYCPWRNKEKAHIYLKDPHFAAPKQPLAGYEWAMEIVCKQWSQLTSADAKDPRQEQCRYDNARYLQVTMDKFNWMTQDLTTYANARTKKRLRDEESDRTAESIENPTTTLEPSAKREKISDSPVISAIPAIPTEKPVSAPALQQDQPSATPSDSQPSVSTIVTEPTPVESEDREEKASEPDNLPIAASPTAQAAADDLQANADLMESEKGLEAAAANEDEQVEQEKHEEHEEIEDVEPGEVFGTPRSTYLLGEDHMSPWAGISESGMTPSALDVDALESLPGTPSATHAADQEDLLQAADEPLSELVDFSTPPQTMPDEPEDAIMEDTLAGEPVLEDGEVMQPAAIPVSQKQQPIEPITDPDQEQLSGGDEEAILAEAEVELVAANEDHGEDHVLVDADHAISDEDHAIADEDYVIIDEEQAIADEEHVIGDEEHAVADEEPRAIDVDAENAGDADQLAATEVEQAGEADQLAVDITDGAEHAEDAAKADVDAPMDEDLQLMEELAETTSPALEEAPTAEIQQPSVEPEAAATEEEVAAEEDAMDVTEMEASEPLVDQHDDDAMEDVTMDDHELETAAQDTKGSDDTEGAAFDGLVDEDAALGDEISGWPTEIHANVSEQPIDAPESPVDASQDNMDVLEDVDTSQPVLDTSESATNASEPVANAPEAAIVVSEVNVASEEVEEHETIEPKSMEAPETPTEFESVTDTTEKTIDVPEVVVDAPEEAAEAHEEAIDASEPAINTPEPVNDASEHAVDATEPIDDEANASEPAVDTSEPTVDASEVAHEAPREAHVEQDTTDAPQEALVEEATNDVPQQDENYPELIETPQKVVDIPKESDAIQEEAIDTSQEPMEEHREALGAQKVEFDASEQVLVEPEGAIDAPLQDDALAVMEDEDGEVIDLDAMDDTAMEEVDDAASAMMAEIDAMDHHHNDDDMMHIEADQDEEAMDEDEKGEEIEESVVEPVIESTTDADLGAPTEHLDEAADHEMDDMVAVAEMDEFGEINKNTLHEDQIAIEVIPTPAVEQALEQAEEEVQDAIVEEVHDGNDLDATAAADDHTDLLDNVLEVDAENVEFVVVEDDDIAQLPSSPAPAADTVNDTHQDDVQVDVEPVNDTPDTT